MRRPSTSLYDGDFQRRRARLKAWAWSHPDKARCWQCGEPLATCGPNRNGRCKTGKPATWHAGHMIDGDRTSPLALECEPCNTARGAAHGNRGRKPRTRSRNRR